MESINILGSKWTIIEQSVDENSLLEECDGFCDNTTRKIVIIKRPENCKLEDWKQYARKVMRHEIIHAFLYESGLQENFNHPEFGHDEVMIDWVAVQFPKLLKVFQELNILDE